MIKDFFKSIHVKLSGGYTLLFAMIVASIVLIIGVGLLTISTKEFLLSSSATFSADAFYAADSGATCAAHWDNNGSNAFSSTTPPSPDTVQCGPTGPTGPIVKVATSSTAVAAGSGDCPSDAISSCYEFSFNTPFSADGGNDNYNSCAAVVVDKYVYDYTYIGSVDHQTHTIPTLGTNITSSGYNIGWSGSDCSSVSPKKVERTIVYTY